MNTMAKALSPEDAKYTSSITTEAIRMYSSYLKLESKNILECLKKSSEELFQVPPGMALSIFQDKYARKNDDGTFEAWDDVISRVLIGNQLLDLSSFNIDEFTAMMRLGYKGVLTTAGRHLQQGDDQQPFKVIELFSNCATSVFSFLTFELLLNGSGVGSDYSNYTRRVNWDYMPNVRLVLNGGKHNTGLVEDGAHPDFMRNRKEFQGHFETLYDAQHKYPSESEAVRWFKVKDSREGWAEVLMILETAAFHEKHKNKLFIFDFSDVRPEGWPIKGHQNRPASGPLALMRCLAKICSIKGIGMPCWKQALFIDDYAAEAVGLGGVRRSSRISTKYWRDRDIFEFIEIKRGGHLKSANNSVLVDDQFWEEAKDKRSHAYRVLQAIIACNYFDQTGEPGFINMSKLNQNVENLQMVKDSYICPNHKMQLHHRTKDMMDSVLGYIMEGPIKFIVNPCSEIVLSVWGGICIIGDIALHLADNINDAFEAAKYMAHFLIRVNTMRGLYKSEIDRTNRIGIGLIGIIEAAWKFFQCTFMDLIEVHDVIVNCPYTMSVQDIDESQLSEKQQSAIQFWKFLDSLRMYAESCAAEYSQRLGRVTPHTVTTLKPSGTVAKVINCTEAANMPVDLWIIRWVQYDKEVVENGKVGLNSKIIDLMNRGYPTMDISHKYSNKMVVGFPTKKPIVEIYEQNSNGSAIVTSSISSEDQYKWLRLLERCWLGYDEEGKPLNNNISYTLKFKLNEMTYEQFYDTVYHNQRTIRMCAFDMIKPIGELRETYGYSPEEPITKETYDAMVAKINRLEKEGYDESLVACENGVCPIEMNIN